MKMAQMVFIDMDGTMLGKEGNLSKETDSVLSKVAKSGVFVVPCTGRCWDELPEDILDKDWLRYAVLTNGARIVDLKAQRTLYENPIAYENLAKLMPMILEIGLVYQLVHEGSEFTDDRFLEITMRSFEEAGTGYAELLRKKRFVKDLHSEIHRRKMNAEKVSIRGVDKATQKKIMSFFEDNPGYTITNFFLKKAGSMSIEVNGTNCDKATAAGVLCDMLEIPMEDVIAIGDGDNDVSMIKSAGLGIAMSNACQEAKAAAGYVTLANDEEGVAVALRKFVV